MPPSSSQINNDMPMHVAIVMDGNGRWAQAQGKPRIFGHRAGVEVVQKIVGHAAKSGTRYLTLYSFSTENWKRPQEEVQALFGLMKTFVQQDLERLHLENVKVVVLGNKPNLPSDIQLLLGKVEQTTKLNTGLHLNIAFNYGGRDEIVRMVQNTVRLAKDGKITVEEINEASISRALDTGGQPDPDIIIRTSGENRISNFLLWQSAYAEFVLLDVFWPDFDENDYDHALEIYKTRRRRLGGAQS